jgi:large subunit ribosomal protein L15
MQIADITKLAGPSKRRKRIGRGRGTGHGKTSGRGTKGAGARAGWKQRGMQEGGQMPIFRRLPKRGFSNAVFRTSYQVVNIGSLEEAFKTGEHVTPQALLDRGLIRHLRNPVKILGTGKLTKKLTIDAAKFSESALKAIESAGGKAVVTTAGVKPTGS